MPPRAAVALRKVANERKTPISEAETMARIDGPTNRPAWTTCLLLASALISGPVFAQTRLKEPTRSTPSLTPVKSNVRMVSSTAPADLGGRDGQVWRTYDLRPYTERISGVEHPERAVVEWILRETGRDLWFYEPIGVLTASKQQLRVYHTPEVQQVVARLVEQLVNSHGRPYVFRLHLVTVNSPAWRSTAMSMMRPVPMRTPGVDAWLISKENAALLRASLAKRMDYREHNPPNLLIANGQTKQISRRRPKNYVRSVSTSSGVGPAALQNAQINEGFDLLLTPLVTVDERVVDAVIECRVDQIERLVSVPVHVPTPAGVPQRVDIQVPQLVTWRLKERFRWPADQVLLLTCGVVATPEPNQSSFMKIPNPFGPSAQRADALVFIEFQGRPSDALTESAAMPATNATNGRY